MAAKKLDFTCNLCGRRVLACPISRLERETVSCTCGSTVRTRCILYALSLRLYGWPLTLPDFPRNKKILGVGLSDQKVYAKPLSKKFAYRNTYLDKAPMLDIVDPGAQAKCDFLISTEVLEHVPQPVERAFRGMASLLKPGGALIFSVPYGLEGDTLEHFPDLFNFTIVTLGGTPALVNRAQDGKLKLYENLVFHGGEGQVVEMRIFSLRDILAHLDRAGFRDVVVMEDDVPEFGIVHGNPLGRIISAVRARDEVNS